MHVRSKIVGANVSAIDVMLFKTQNAESSLSNLGLVYFDMGDYEKAEPLQIEAKAIRKKTVICWIRITRGTSTTCLACILRWVISKKPSASI